jgi:hypothetical protein
LPSPLCSTRTCVPTGSPSIEMLWCLWPEGMLDMLILSWKQTLELWPLESISWPYPLWRIQWRNFRQRRFFVSKAFSATVTIGAGKIDISTVENRNPRKQWSSFCTPSILMYNRKQESFPMITSDDQDLKVLFNKFHQQIPWKIFQEWSLI